MKTHSKQATCESKNGFGQKVPTPKQQRFVEEYLVDLNATQAAIRAGYSRKTAGATGHENLRKPEIAAAVSAAQAARANKVGIDAEWVLRRLAIEADADIADIYDGQGNLRHPTKWPDVWRRGLVLGVETFQAATGEADESGKPIYATVRKVKLADRIRQIELIGKHVRVSAFREQVGLSDPQGGPVQIMHAVELSAIQRALERVRSQQACSETKSSVSIANGD